MKEAAKFIQWAKDNGYGKISVSPDALAVFVEYLDYSSNSNNKPFVIPAVSVSLPDDAQIEQVACDEMQQDWNDLRFQKIYKDGYISGALWMRRAAGGN